MQSADILERYRRIESKPWHPKAKRRPVLIVDNTPKAQPVPVFYVQPEIVYLPRPRQQVVYLSAAATAQITRVKVRTIIDEVAAFYQESVSEILSHRRTAGLTKYRQIAMYLAREMTTLTLPQIGKQFDRDHTTVLHGARKIKRRLEADDRLRDEIDVLKLRIADRGLA